MQRRAVHNYRGKRMGVHGRHERMGVHSYKKRMGIHSEDGMGVHNCKPRLGGVDRHIMRRWVSTIESVMINEFSCLLVIIFLFRCTA